MKMRESEPASLWGWLTAQQHRSDRFLSAAQTEGWLTAQQHRSDRFLSAARTEIRLADTLRGSCLGGGLAELRGRSVVLATEDQLSAALALFELDGVARRIVLCPPDLPRDQLAAVAGGADADAVVSDREAPHPVAAAIGRVIKCSPAILPDGASREPCGQTEWILLTSGTTGSPKLVVHTLASLTAPIKHGGAPAFAPVWSTFYDIRRYGGLQIFLRAILGGGSMVLSDANEPTGAFLTRAGARGVTHISGTPSHWRRALMSPAARAMTPRYVRMSGEIADQSIIDHLQAAYPDAGVAHAFASTEAGVAFEVGDGLPGFPASLIGRDNTEVEIKVEDGSLRIRSSRTASRYIGGADRTLVGADGFVDTGDIVEQRGDRYYFVGRGDGTINVGGRKVHPEEVEAVINRHPGVRMSLVKARRSPITGAVVVAEIVANRPLGDPETSPEAALLRQEILAACHAALAAHKAPVALRFVPSLRVTGSGKLARSDA